jgi:4-amino-4-deoxy-L-arabinose transferase-like glycosyltransferase
MGMVFQAAAFRVFGFGLLVQRELSVICGSGAVLFWYLALRRLVADRVAALAAVLLSVDFVFLSLSSIGRSDMISLFFSMAALAAYMHWRERSLTLAIGVSSTACALSGMVHPNAGVATVVSLAVLILYLDRRRLRWSHLIVVGVCYGVLGLGWGLYIAKAPDLFAAQFMGNIAIRLGHRMTLTRFAQGEMMRYKQAYELENARGVRMLRYLLPISYLASILFCAISKDLRRRYGILLLMFVAVCSTLIFLEGTKKGWYLVHLCPLFAAFVAISVTRLWESGNTLARMIGSAQILIVLLGVASLAYSASNRNLQRLYQPTVEFLNAHVGPHDLVFAPSEFYFGLQCRTCFRDDENLGALSGRRAQYIVFSPDYVGHLSELQEKSPVIYRAIEQRLNTEYQEVFRNPNYQVMRRTADSF